MLHLTKYIYVYVGVYIYIWGGSELPLEGLLAVGGPLQAMDDVVEVCHLLVTPLDAGAEPGAGSRWQRR